MNLRPVIRVGEYEVFISIPATVTPAIALDAAASVVTGTFRIGQAIANGNIALHYTSYANQEVTVSADEVSGISIAEFTASLPAAPSGGRPGNRNAVRLRNEDPENNYDAGR